MLNCIDKDGTNSGFDIGLVNAMKAAVTIPVIASSGAGSAQHFLECFEKTPVEAALAVRPFTPIYSVLVLIPVAPSLALM